RECSGLILLSGCHRVIEELQWFFTSALQRGQYPATYCFVPMGVPAEPEGKIHTGLCWQQQGGLKAVVVPQRVPVPGCGSLARKEVKNTLTWYQVLGATGGCALLQLQPKTSFPEQVPVHPMMLLWPALGYHQHSSWACKVLGLPFFLLTEPAPTHTQV
ncbi:RNA pseudouridylate synthase domain-containing protein 3, partial [Nestor notabilis]